MKFLGILLILFLPISLLTSDIPISLSSDVQAAPVTSHPRLWLTANDLPRLRSWAVSSNPVFQNGLAVLAANAKADMDAGLLTQDTGGTTWDQYPNEMYAQLFAFMSLISGNQTTRDDYAQRARTALMFVMNEAVKGAASGQPFRDPTFSTSDRSRWWGEGFALTVDWIYAYLSSSDKTTIRQVFLRWADENENAGTTNNNNPGWNGVQNDPSYVSDPILVRWSANNYYMAHMRNMGLMAMAFDQADDPGNQLSDYLKQATGAWLFVIDNLLSNDAKGGFTSEGWEYAPQALSYAAHFLLALQTAGQDDPAAWGQQVVFGGNSFWDDMMTAYLHSLSPSTVIPSSTSWIGEAYQPAWFGDGQNYYAPDFIGVFGPMGIYDYNTGNTTRLQSIRWIQTYLPPDGANSFLDRVGSDELFRDAILYFMLFEPAAASPADPKSGLPLNFYAPGIGRILARTGWDTNAAFFSYILGFITIDHQHAEGSQFEFYRQGEWLTKERVGYDGSTRSCTIGRSDYHNTLALENDMVITDPTYWLYECQTNGSQWLRDASDDGKILAHSFGSSKYVYVLGDSTELYNSTNFGATDITHASRSIFWLKPDHIVIYDRAASQTSGRFKRFWLNLPTQAVVSGNQAVMTTSSGQQLFVTTLLPGNAVVTSTQAESGIGEANDETMKYRLLVEAPGGPPDVRFLHVLQGANAGAGADQATLVQSSSGTPFAGAVVNNTAILFPVDISTSFTNVTYTVPAGTTSHFITGLTPNGKYDFVTQAQGANIQVTISPGTTYQADSGGVFQLSPLPDIKANGSDEQVSISTNDTLTLTVALNAGNSAGQNADWWMAAYVLGGWYYYTSSGAWLPGLTVNDQRALSDMSSVNVFNGALGLPPGAYHIYFGVDLTMDGIVNNPIYYDSVTVNVTQ